MKFHDFSPFYRSGEGIRSKVAGDRLIDNPAVADAQGGSGACFSFDGTDDYVSNGSFPAVGLDGNYSITAWVKADSLPVGYAGLLEWGDQTLGERRSVMISSAGTGNKIDCSHYSSHVYGGTTVPVGEWFFAAVTVASDGSASIYLNGVLDGTGTLLLNDFVGTVMYLGRTGSNEYFDGQISQGRVHNRVLSAAEVRAAYNGQAVPYEYVGGKHLYTSDFSSGVDGWAATRGTATGNIDGIGSLDNNLRFAADSSTSNTHHIYYTVSGWPYAFTDPHKMRISFDIYIPSGNSVIDRFQWITGGGLYNSGLITPTADTWHSVSHETASNGVIAIYQADSTGTTPAATATGDLIYVRNVRFDTIGCVAEYLPSGINATQWVDTSGNGLHGTTSTATAVNHTTGTLTMVDDIKLQAGAGIDFSNYGAEEDPDVAATDVTGNLLDDYEVGEWTPVMADASSGGNTEAVTSNYSVYTKHETKGE